MDDTLPLRSRALQFLRELRGWTQQELADAAGVSLDMISKWERGIRIPSLKKFRQLTRLLGHTEATAREVLRLLSAPVAPQERWIGPVHFTAEQERELADFGDESGRLVAFSLCQGVRRSLVQNAVDRERRKAQALRAVLVAEPSLKAAVQRKKEYQTWAVAELLCEESIRAASRDPQRALELAEAAVTAAEQAPGEEKWKLRLEGYAQAHVGNAWRVIGKLQISDQAFAQYSQSWKAGEGGDPGRILNEGRVFGLEASLRREQDRPQEALALLEEGLAVGSRTEKSYLLINRAKALAAQGSFGDALKELSRSASYIRENTPGLLPNVYLEFGVSLCNSGRFAEARQVLPELKACAIQLGAEMSLVRAKWLEGKITAGMGDFEEAAPLFYVVLSEFINREMFFDAALVAMELAEALLQLHQLERVTVLSRQMMPIFASQQLPERVLAALNLFLRAAEAEAASLELVRSLAAYLEKSQSRPDLDFSPPREA